MLPLNNIYVIDWTGQSHEVLVRSGLNLPITVTNGDEKQTCLENEIYPSLELTEVSENNYTIQAMAFSIEDINQIREQLLIRFTGEPYKITTMAGKQEDKLYNVSLGVTKNG